MSAEERAADYRRRLSRDLTLTWRQHHAGDTPPEWPMIDAMVEDAMFPVEHLLAEIEDLHNERATLVRHALSSNETIMRMMGLK